MLVLDMLSGAETAEADIYFSLELLGLFDRPRLPYSRVVGEIMLYWLVLEFESYDPSFAARARRRISRRLVGGKHCTRQTYEQRQ